MKRQTQVELAGPEQQSDLLPRCGDDGWVLVDTKTAERQSFGARHVNDRALATSGPLCVRRCPRCNFPLGFPCGTLDSCTTMAQDYP